MRLLRFISCLILAAGIALFVVATLVNGQEKSNAAPVITMAEDSLTVTCDTDEEGLLKGVTATDEEDGDITFKIIVENDSNFIEKGRCRVYYAVFDSNGNVGTASRMLTYSDYTSPTITLNEPLSFQMGASVQVLDKITATDCIDGDLTSKVEVMNSTVSSDYVGVYYVSLEVSNSHGDTAQQTFPVVIYDKEDHLDVTLTAPVVTLAQGSEFVAKSYLTGATDDEGKAVTLVWKEDAEAAEAAAQASKKKTTTTIPSVNVNVSGNVDTTTPGTYFETYTIMDDDGNRGTAVLTVIVEEGANG